MEIMPDVHLQVAIDRFLAAQPFYPCCLLVHPDIGRLHDAGEELIGRHSWPALSLGLLLGEALLHVVPERRSAEVQHVIVGALRQPAPGPVVLTNIDILFEPALSLDPLRLLRDLSRVAPIIVTWPGSFVDGVLAYATADPPHAHYRAWRQPELCQDCIVPLR